MSGTTFSREPMSSSPILLNGGSKTLFVNCTVENTGVDHAYFLRVNVSSGNLTVNKMISSCMTLADDESDPSSGSTVVKYHGGSSLFKDLMVAGDKCNFSIEFDFTKLQSSANEAQLRISGKVSSNAGGDQVQYDPDESNNEFHYYRSLQYKSTPVIAGVSVPESVFVDLLENNTITTVRTLEDAVLGGAETNFHHKYTIYNGGPLGLANAKIRISWPEFSENGYRLIYLVDVRCEPIESCTCEKDGKTNSLRIAPNEASIRPYYQEVVIDYPNAGEGFKSIEEVACQNSICANISCDVDYVEKFGRVNVFALFKPWIPSFDKNFVKAGFFSSFKIIPSKLTQLPISTEAKVVSLITSFDPENPPPTLPSSAPNIGAIIGGVIGGILLLAIATVIMWKAGFFQSKYGNMTRDARQTIRAQRPEGVEGDYEGGEVAGQSTDPQQMFKSTEQLCE